MLKYFLVDPPRKIGQVVARLFGLFSLIGLFLLSQPGAACEVRCGTINDWTAPQPTVVQTTPTSTPTPPVQPEKLPPIGSPWTYSADAGYCPVSYGSNWRGYLTWPVPPNNLRPFGYLPGTTHTGLDISAPLNTPVYAPTGGILIWAGYTSAGFGEMVAIASSGRIVILAHLNGVVAELNRNCGMTIYQNQLVGYSGMSGAATWPHVHLELRYQGYAWDPLDYLQ